MRKLVGLLSLFLGAPVLAYGMPNSPFLGFYIGPTVGYSVGQISYRSSSPPGSNSVTTRDYNAQGFLGGVDVGFGKQFSRFYLGPELQYVSSSYRSNENFSSPGGSQSLNISQSNLLSLGIRLGYLINCTVLPYIYAGYAYSKFNVREQNTVSSLNFDSLDSINKKIKGPEYGIGLSFPLSPHLFFNSAFYHAKYNESLSHVVTISPGIQKDARYTPYQNRLMTSIVYTLG